MRAIDWNVTARMGKPFVKVFEEERIVIESRIDLIQDLKRKYGNNIAEILEYKNTVKEQIDEIENLSDYIESLKDEKKEIEIALEEFAQKMHQLREKYAESHPRDSKEIWEKCDPARYGPGRARHDKAA